MKYCVATDLAFETSAKRDTMSQAVIDNIGAKLTWGEKIIQSGINDKGKPSHSLMVRFETKADMDDLFDLIKDKMIKIPALKGTVSRHDCPHDTGGICVISEIYEKI